MEKDIKLVFHNRGLRSYIEVDLCAECPRMDNKGCCGYYSPVFYPLDLYFLRAEDPRLIDRIFNLPSFTVLDASVTVNSSIDSNGGYQCRFHSPEAGCALAQHQRESVCRHFVCPGIAWWEEPGLAEWKDFFAHLENWENELNRSLSNMIEQQGLSLRNPSDRELIWSLLDAAVPALLEDRPSFLDSVPELHVASVRRMITWGNEWPL